MTVASKNRLIDALAKTAERLNRGDIYRWTHMGRCNCGHLAQTVTEMSGAELHAAALEKSGDWAAQLDGYCESSGYRIDDVIATLLDLGCTLDELRHLERLTDPRVLRRLPIGMRNLHYRDRNDVVLYMQTWRNLLLEDQQAAPVAAASMV